MLLPVCNIPNFQINKDKEFPNIKNVNQQKLLLTHVLCIIPMFNSCAIAMMIDCVISNDAKTLTYDPMINNRERNRKNNNSTHTCAYGYFAKL
jgi:hypothetical protein